MNYPTTARARSLDLSARPHLPLVGKIKTVEWRTFETSSRTIVLSCDGDFTIREGDWLRLWTSDGVGIAHDVSEDLPSKMDFAESKLGTLWAGFYNCQDFASEVATGKPQSFQRDAVVAL